MGKRLGFKLCSLHIGCLHEFGSVSKTREGRLSERCLRLFVNVVLCRHEAFNISLLGVGLAEGVIGFRYQRFSPFRLNHNTAISRGKQAVFL